ncbi:DUF222 domain-containing protein [Kribbella sp. NPDC004875]|uniref:HNH endonuclease signature motif containing protein n=1 Tax=Kribbella sp. NPDC004875 TaxID=3364107 RepID=UPI0036C9F4A2
MELLGERPPEVMSERELVHALDQSHADLARLETYRLRLLAALDQTGHAETVGARDTVQFIEYRYRLDHFRARRDMQLARALPKYQAVSAALADDAESVVLMRPAQAEAIVLELEKAPSTVPVDDLDCAEHELVRLARHLPPADLRKAAVQARDILDTDGPEPEERKASARETLTLTPADRGVKFKGYLANENAELLRTVIITGARPHRTIDGEPDPRSREKRQADALTTALTLAATALDTGTPSPTIPRPTKTTPPAPASPTGSAGSTPPACASPIGSTDTAGRTAAAFASPTTSTESAERTSAAVASVAGAVDSAGRTPPAGSSASGSSDSAGRAGSSGDVVPGFGAKANITVTIDLQDLQAATADAIGQTVYSNGLSAVTLRRLACDAKIIPVVLGSKSEPLDVGRSERLVTRAMRRALNTRDRGCVVCGAPPVMCDAHHLISWVDGGVTAVSNLVLLCRRHHADLHAGHWHITITDDTVHVTRPTWADPPPPRHHNPPRRAPQPSEQPTPKPRDPKPRDPKPRDPKPRDPKPRDPKPRDPKPREPALREPALREPALREPASRELALREPEPREPELREPASREPASREPALREPASREPASRELALRKPASRELALREPEPREPELREPELREPELREPASREPASRELALREPELRESASREPELRKPASRGPEPREPELRKPASREPASREPALGQPESREPEPASRELASREPEARGGEARGGDSWSRTVLSAPAAAGPRTSRWKSTDATLANAALFAMHGIAPQTESGIGPPPFATT